MIAVASLKETIADAQSPTNLVAKVYLHLVIMSLRSSSLSNMPVSTYPTSFLTRSSLIVEAIYAIVAKFELVKIIKYPCHLMRPSSTEKN